MSYSFTKKNEQCLFVTTASGRKVSFRYNGKGSWLVISHWGAMTTKKYILAPSWDAEAIKAWSLGDTGMLDGITGDEMVFMCSGHETASSLFQSMEQEVYDLF